MRPSTTALRSPPSIRITTARRRECISTALSWKPFIDKKSPSVLSNLRPTSAAKESKSAGGVFSPFHLASSKNSPSKCERTIDLLALNSEWRLRVDIEYCEQSIQKLLQRVASRLTCQSMNSIQLVLQFSEFVGNCALHLDPRPLNLAPTISLLFLISTTTVWLDHPLRV